MISQRKNHLLFFLTLAITRVLIKGQWIDNVKYNLLKTCLTAKGVNTQSLLVERDLNSNAYVDSNFQYNLCCGGLYTPMSYLKITNTYQIQSAVICCKLLGIRIVAKSGGHSMGKYGFGDSNSLVLDLRRMNNLHVNKRKKRAIVGPGIVTGKLAYELYKHDGLGVPIGECVVIGITVALGGGYGIFSRLHGLTGDSILELEMVDANGQKLIANNTTNSDLFWALRGAGAGSFGIVTSYTFNLVNMPKVVIWGEIEYSMDEFPQVFDSYQKYIMTNPPRTMNLWMLIPPKIAGAEDKLVFYLFQHQSTAEEIKIGQKEVTNILTNQFPSGGTRKLVSMDLMDFMREYGYLHQLSRNVTSTDQFEHISGYDFGNSIVERYRAFVVSTSGILEPEGILELHRLLKMRPYEIASVNLGLMGGAINDLKPNDTAYVHRQQALYEVRPHFLGTKEQESKGKSWLTDFYERTKYLMHHTETFQNHVDLDLPDYLQRYYGQNLKRLIAIKRKYDPDNIFNNPQSIPTN